MATEHIDEPKCTQKGTGWVSFDASPKPRKRKVIKKIVKKNWKL